MRRRFRRRRLRRRALPTLGLSFRILPEDLGDIFTDSLRECGGGRAQELILDFSRSRRRHLGASNGAFNWGDGLASGMTALAPSAPS
jgi:hypothetical protein